MLAMYSCSTMNEALPKVHQLKRSYREMGVAASVTNHLERDDGSEANKIQFHADLNIETRRVTIV